MFRLFTWIKYYALIIFLSILTYLQPLFGQTDTVKIMPFGDSITRGSTGSYGSGWSYLGIGYRGGLFDQLTKMHNNNGSIFPPVNFVGDRSDGPTGGYHSSPYYNSLNYYDRDHEGYSGYTTTDLISLVKSDILNSDQNPADIILLHVGTNDIEGGSDPNTISNNLNELLNDIRDPSYNNYNASSVVIFLAKIILDDNDNQGINGTKATITKQYNSDLVNVAVNRIKSGHKLIVVNMQNALNYPNANTTLGTPPQHYNDIFWGGGHSTVTTDPTLLHPYQTGYDKMTGVWYRALSNYYQGIPTLIAPDSAIVNLTFPNTLAWGISSGVTNYTYQVSTSSSFGTFVYNSSTTNRYFTLNDPTQFLSSTKYYWRVSGASYSNTWNFTTSPLYVNVHVLLQGPYAGSGTMTTTLNSGHYLPTSQPYSGSPWNYGGTEQVSSNFFSNHTSIVDWVLIELRSNTAGSTMVKQRAAFLKSDGTVVDTDGVSPVNFSGISFGNYYIVVRHRNHLAVMSNVASNLSTDTLSFDLTHGSAYGTNGQVSLGGGYYAMWAGDANADGGIFAEDYTAYQLSQGSKNYNSADYNMDGGVFAEDYTIYQLNQGKKTSVP